MKNKILLIPFFLIVALTLQIPEDPPQDPVITTEITPLPEEIPAEPEPEAEIPEPANEPENSANSESSNSLPNTNNLLSNLESLLEEEPVDTNVGEIILITEDDEAESLGLLVEAVIEFIETDTEVLLKVQEVDQESGLVVEQIQELEEEIVDGEKELHENMENLVYLGLTDADEHYDSIFMNAEDDIMLNEQSIDDFFSAEEEKFILYEEEREEAVILAEENMALIAEDTEIEFNDMIENEVLKMDEIHEEIFLGLETDIEEHISGSYNDIRDKMIQDVVDQEESLDDQLELAQDKFDDLEDTILDMIAIELDKAITLQKVQWEDEIEKASQDLIDLIAEIEIDNQNTKDEIMIILAQLEADATALEAEIVEKEQKVTDIEAEMINF